MDAPKGVASPSKIRSISGRRLWLFRALALLGAPTLVLVALESVVQLSGYGYTTQATIQHELNGRKVYCENHQFGWQFFPRQISRHLAPFLFQANKPSDVYRIFVLGASAAAGEPDSAYSFSRVLEVMLRNAYPEIEFEVINMSMTAINSHVVYQIAKDCRYHQPDLFIVYTGHRLSGQ